MIVAELSVAVIMLVAGWYIMSHATWEDDDD